MLSRREKSVLTAVLGICGGKDCCIVSAGDILSAMPKSNRADEDSVKATLNFLDYEGYLSIINTVRRGEAVFCIEVKQRGKSYRRESRQSLNFLLSRVGVAVLSAIITYIIGKILYLFL